jgi:predicted transcriptional regulator
MERLCDLYFELSNEERLMILHLLKEKSDTLTGLSERLDIRNQQCSRHLSRLTDKGLIQKTVEGGYEITSFGSAILRLQPTLGFLTDNSEYFSKHSLAGLPDASMNSVGMLGRADQVKDLNLAQFLIAKIIDETGETLHEVINQFHLNTIQPRNEALKRGVKLTSIESYDTVMPSSVRDWFRSDPDYASTSFDVRDQGLVSEFVIPRLSYILHMSEKEAFITFPVTSGAFDFIGFTSKDHDFLEWCRNLFTSTLNASTPKGQKIRECYAEVLEDESLVGEIRDFKGPTKKLLEHDLVSGNDLTVIGEVIRLYLNRDVPLSMIDPDSYWKQMK